MPQQVIDRSRQLIRDGSDLTGGCHPRNPARRDRVSVQEACPGDEVKRLNEEPTRR